MQYHVLFSGEAACNNYLMQFQSDILSGSVLVPNTEELSAIGAAYAAGLSLGIYNESIFGNIERKVYNPQISNNIQEKNIIKKYIDFFK